MNIPRFMTIDCETTGLDWTTDKLHGFSVGYDEDSAVYYTTDAVPDQIRKDLENKDIAKVGHNLHGFDAKFLAKSGFKINGEFDDSMVIWNLIDADMPLGLKYLSEKIFGPGSLEKKRFLDKYLKDNGCRHVGELCAKDLLDPTRPHHKVIAEYCVEDNINTTRVFLRGLKKLHDIDKIIKQKYKFKKSPLDYYYEEARPLERVLFNIEYRGTKINLKVIEKLRKDATDRMALITQYLTKAFGSRIATVEQALLVKWQDEVTTEKAKAKRKLGEGKAKFSWTNKNHVAKLFYETCDIPDKLIFKTKKGKYQTDKAAIETIANNIDQKSPLVKYLRYYAEYKLHEKIASTYTGDLEKGIYSKLRFVAPNGSIHKFDPNFPDREPRIYPRYRQTTGTGRLACTNPNLQNLKRDSDVKKFFVPDIDTEVFDDADYSQIELRVGAHLTQDLGLVDAYTRNIDVHLVTASRLFKKNVTKADDLERQAGKRTNFLTIFDGGAFRLQTALKADTGRDFSIEECKEFIRIWFETYPQVREYIDSQIDFFERYQFCISEFGRIRRLPDIVFGQHIQWKKDGDRWTPIYQGNQDLRDRLLSRILKSNKKLKASDVTESMLGWEASKRYKHAIKAGLNQPIQGYAASLAKRSMIELYRRGRKIANQVHDQLLVARPKWDLEMKKELVDVMVNIHKMTVPNAVDIKTLNSFHPKDRYEEEKTNKSLAL